MYNYILHAAGLSSILPSPTITDTAEKGIVQLPLIIALSLCGTVILISSSIIMIVASYILLKAHFVKKNDG